MACKHLREGTYFADPLKLLRGPHFVNYYTCQIMALLNNKQLYNKPHYTYTTYMLHNIMKNCSAMRPSTMGMVCDEVTMSCLPRYVFHSYCICKLDC